MGEDIKINVDLNKESHDTLRWILNNANSGLYLFISSQSMQEKLARMYANEKIAVYDYLKFNKSYSFFDLNKWANANTNSTVFMIINLQTVMRSYNDMQSKFY